MKVQLAYEYEGHEPDEVIEVDDMTARTLTSEGRARVPDKTRARSTSESKSEG